MTTLRTDVDATTLRNAFGMYPSGVVAVAALVDGTPVGLAASSFVAVSMDPPLVGFCIQHSSTTWPRLSSAPHIGLSVLSDSHAGAARALASRTGDRFAALDIAVSDRGAVFVEESPVWFDTTKVDEFAAGDHSIVVMHVDALEARHDIEPLVFHRSQFRTVFQAAE